MKLCRFNENRIGVVEDDTVRDVTQVLETLPTFRWPFPLGDQLIANLPRMRDQIDKIARAAPSIPLARVMLRSPVANPSKIIGAPVNYRDHLEEARTDTEIAHGHNFKPVSEWGLFLKAVSALVGPGDGVAQRFPERRNDHEAEFSVVIGLKGTNIPRAKALDYVAGYCIGLDMTVRGPQFQCFRKSVDTYAVLGPWLTTKDEIADPSNIDLALSVNGELRQKSNTRYMDYDVAQLIELASSYYTLYPGDIIMTGTPAGVGPVKPGDEIEVAFSGLGKMRVRVRLAKEESEPV
jgi:2-keto-4-pentenoate hydratase/2-oxohepta-3-ene-1,7-dioic acid hydratase in catechol pathway